jgi:hypothetical protein
MNVHQAGYRNVVGLMGSNLSGDQRACCKSTFEEPFLCWMAMRPDSELRL